MDKNEPLVKNGVHVYKILGGGLLGCRIEMHQILRCLDIAEHEYEAKPAAQKKHPINGNPSGTFMVRLRPQSQVTSIEKIQSTDHWCLAPPSTSHKKKQGVAKNGEYQNT